MATLPLITADASPHGSITIDGDEDFTTENGVSSGNGTEEDPYLIKDLNISGPERWGIRVEDTRKHLIIADLVLRNTTGLSRPFQFVNATNITVINIDCEGASSIFIEGCTDIEIINYSNNGGGIYIHESERISVINCSISEVPYGWGQQPVYFLRSSGLTVANCSLSSGKFGIWIKESNDVDILNNSIFGFVTNGIQLASNDPRGMGANISGNNISGGFHGIWVDYWDGVSITNNTVYDGKYHCIRIDASTLDRFTDNRMVGGALAMFPETVQHALMEFTNNTIDGKLIGYIASEQDIEIDGQFSQFYIVNCTGCSIEDRVFTSVEDGIVILFSKGIRVSSCLFINVTYPLYDSNGQTNIFEGNTFYQANIVIELRDSAGDKVLNNTFEDVEECVLLRGCHDMTISNNKVMNSTWAFRNWVLPENSTNFIVDGNVIMGTSFPIRFELLQDSRITRNTISGMSINEGIRLDRPSSNVTIQSNIITDVDVGLDVQYLTDGTIASNVIIGGLVGMDLDSLDRSVIEFNSISGCSGYGLDLNDCSYTDIIGNEISLCLQEAMKLRGDNNRIYHNNFISNVPSEPNTNGSQVYLNRGTNNEWDNGEEGNYWSGYRDRYPMAVNNGNVWDEAYNVSPLGGSFWYAKGWDRFPLVLEMDFQPPVVNAGDDQTVNEGDPVLLDGSRCYDNKGIRTFLWSFEYEGVVKELEGEKTAFTFYVPGSYVVTLSVADLRGNWQSDELIINVLDAFAPTAVIEGDLEVDQNTEVTLDGSNSHDTGGIINHTWQIDNGNDSTWMFGDIISIVLEYPGPYTINLTVTDTAGFTDIATVQVWVRDSEPPEPNTNLSMIVPQGERFQMDGSGSTDNIAIYKYTWTLKLPDGTVFLNGPKAELSIEDIGMFPFILTVEDCEGNNASVFGTITVIDNKLPIADAGQDQTIDAGELCRLNGSRSSDNLEIETYQWTIELDGRTVILYGVVTSYLFNDPGNYSLILNVTDVSGFSSQDQVMITVRPLDTNRDGNGDGHPNDEGEPSFSFPYLAIISAIVVALAVGAFYFYKAQKRDG